MNKSEAIEVAKILRELKSLNEVSKILSDFMPSFLEKTIDKGDGCVYLHGNFNLGGTVSGRLSSSKVNLQNLPSTGSKYAKHIKSCFKAPPGWVMVGADFDSLEDKISALTTKDPNKLKVYTDGYDGHCLRAYSYFTDEMPDIDPTTVEGINSIEEKYKPLRQKSKAPTFALTYQGTYHTLVNNLGFSEELAKQIESRYHELYKVSDEWVQKKLLEATKTGYVEVAFGLKVRTPILSKTVLGNSYTPYEAQAEGRTAGNALGQSYGLLNNRSAIEFMQRVYDSPYRTMVLPIAQIHDSQYYIIKDDINLLKWVNDNLTECMSWQDLPDIQHDVVKISASLEVFPISWEDSIKIPNGASLEEIQNLLQ